MTSTRNRRLIYYSGLTLGVVLNRPIHGLFPLLALAGPHVGVNHLGLDIHARIVKHPLAHANLSDFFSARIETPMRDHFWHVNLHDIILISKDNSLSTLGLVRPRK